jgi:hypothetical protein
MSKKRCIIMAAIVAVVAVLLTLLIDTLVANHQPTITRLAAPERVLPSGTCQIVCNATDPGGDKLTYGWSASGGTISGEGAVVTYTAPSSEGSYNVTVVVVDSCGSGVTDYVTVAVRRNNAPDISSLVASAVWTFPSSSLNVTCAASDPDGDELSYEWSATGGHIAGTGPEATWTAPQEVGIYYITVVVTDGHDRSDTRTLPISVAPEEPPTIDTLNITKDRYGHCYLKPYSGGYYVGMGKMYDIACVVSDTDTQLSYEWSCTGGELSETFEGGSMIAWTAPDTSGKVTITVIVSDIAGNMATKSLVLTVASCSTCTFGSCTG